MKILLVIGAIVLGLLIVLVGRNFWGSQKKKGAGKLPDDRYPLW
jgi:hypothetical protein